jgi:uncharacterized protein (TIGR00251 family)
MHADLRVRVQPRAKRAGIGEWRGDALVVRVTAPPVEGRANAAVRKAIAEAAGVPASKVTIVRGRASRDKTLRVEGVSADYLVRRLGRP